MYYNNVTWKTNFVIYILFSESKKKKKTKQERERKKKVMYRDSVSAYTGNLLAQPATTCAVGSRKMLRDEVGILAACSIYLGVYILCAGAREMNNCCGNYRFADFTEIEYESLESSRESLSVDTLAIDTSSKAQL